MLIMVNKISKTNNASDKIMINTSLVAFMARIGDKTNVIYMDRSDFWVKETLEEILYKQQNNYQYGD